MKKLILAIIVLVVLGGGYMAWQKSKHPAVVAEAAPGDHAEVDEHGHKHGESEGDKHEDDHGDEHSSKDEHGHEESGEKTVISDEAAKQAGIGIAVAGPATIRETIPLNGRIVLNQNKTALVKARFQGIVRDVKKSQGDSVKAGDVLASVESNESLQVYPVKSPIAGTVLVRNTNIGDVAGEEPIFTIADLSEVWAELHVFPQDASRIRSGTNLIVSSSECGSNGNCENIQTTTIQSMLPLSEASTQTLLARAVVKNLDAHWFPGMSVRGDAEIASRNVAVAVKSGAIQNLEGKTVVFAKEGNAYEARPVTIGFSDKQWTEITGGLNAGENYVSEGSFVVKADIGKSGASHEH